MIYNTNEAIANKIDITVHTVNSGIQKYLVGGIDNTLNDCKVKGCKKEISGDDIIWRINKTVKTIVIS